MQKINKERNIQINKNIKMTKDKDEWFRISYKESDIRGNFDKFKDRFYIKKVEDTSFVEKDSGEDWGNVVAIKFNSKYIDEDFINDVYEHHIKLVNEKGMTFFQSLNTTLDYFSNGFEKKASEVLIGDIGEILFLLRVKDITGKNLSSTIHQNDKSLYDFKINDLYVDVKCTSLDKKEIILSDCQVEYLQNRIFAISQVKFIDSGETIVELYQRLDGQLNSELLKKKLSMWSEKNNKELIQQFSINYDSVKFDILKEECIPRCTITNKSALKKSKFYIDVTQNLDSFEEFIKKIDLNNY